MAFTTMSTKGQIVIPHEMRKDLFPGEKILLLKEGKNFVFKPAKELSESLRDDIAFATRVEEAFLRREKGKVIRQSGEEFLEEIKGW